MLYYAAVEDLTGACEKWPSSTAPLSSLEPRGGPLPGGPDNTPIDAQADEAVCTTSTAKYLRPAAAALYRGRALAARPPWQAAEGPEGASAGARPCLPAPVRAVWAVWQALAGGRRQHPM